MEPSRTQLLLLIVCLFVIAVPVLAQTGATPTTVAVAGDPNLALPDAPSPAPKSAGSNPWAAVRPTAQGKQIMAMDKEFALVNGLMFGSSIANVELTTRCLENGACTMVPSGLRSRKRLYAVSLPADVGITALGYYLKRSGHRWWFVPAALVTAGNAIYAVHAAKYMH
jgi:hypothetical protein